MANILIIDDDPMIRDTLSVQLKSLNHRPMVAEALADGLEMVSSGPFDVVFLDVALPDGNGLEAMPSIRRAPSKPEVIIITGEGDAEGAELAINSGAWDYIQKPFSKQEITLQLTRALDYRASRKALKESSLVTLKRPEIVGDSPQLNAKLDIAAQCAKSDANVLITGDTGTGKELFAKVIHNNCSNPDGNFVVVDCAALPEQLAESVLFGHVKGAFTGADRDREGLIKEAHGGTLFLDEIGELPMSIQKKFLRVLQERRFKHVSGTREIQSRFRLIAATNRNLDKMVKAGQFRNDLLFRLRTFFIALPPLRICKQDIRDLTLYYIDKLCRHNDLENKGFVPEFMEILETYDWPGNVRELINTLEKAILAGPATPTLYPMYLPDNIRIQYTRSSVAKKRAEAGKQASDLEPLQTGKTSIPLNLSQPLPALKNIRDLVTEQVESLYLKQLMLSAHGDLDQASEISGLSKSHLYGLLKKYNISRTKK